MPGPQMLDTKRILLVITGGIAAYKCLELIRRLKERGAAVRVVMTKAAQQFVTPLSVGALSGDRVYSDLFDLTAEHDIGHIQLSRDADLVVVAPATADIIAKMAAGLADDLATNVLLATNKPVLIAPAMNPMMWAHPATTRNVGWLKGTGVTIVGPNVGAMAERGEFGPGRMVEPMELLAAIEAHFAATDAPKPLAGKHIVITSGPTHEPIDPVRYIANRSSGKQGHAIAAAAVAAGARVTLISGPVTIPDPTGATVVHIETARQMLEAVEAALPADIAIFAAAVADWRVEGQSTQKIKKGASGTPGLQLVENPDILATIGKHATARPQVVVGFAAETENLTANAEAKLLKKGADLIVANDVSPETGIMGGDRNTVRIISRNGVEDWPEGSKEDVARRLIERVGALLGGAEPIG